MHDAVVVGAGPNGLSAAVTLAAAGRSVLVLEAHDEIGGGTRTAELTLPGFHHDVCSAIHPLGVGSPYWSTLDLGRHGLRWLQPEVPLAHPLDGGDAAVLHRDVADTAAGLGADGRAWERWIGPLVRRWDVLVDPLTAPLLRVPRHPLALARFGLPALLPATVLFRALFREPRARALLGGCAAHAFLPLTRPLTASFGLVLAMAGHAVGWPVAEGGSAAISAALAARLAELGGEVRTGAAVRSWADVPEARAVLFDLAPAQVADIAGEHLPARYVARLRRYRHGPAVFKVDYALDGPVPWANEGCRRAGTVHVAGPLDELVDGEAEVARGHHAERPFVLVGQQSVADPSRAPAGKHTLWAYCHVPNGSTVDMTDAIDRQIDRFAPGFRDLVLARHTAGPSWYEAYNPAFRGGDIAGGSHNGMQLLARPTFGPAYRTPNRTILLCSASTPPGAGAHGMCGHHAATVALRTALR